MRPDRPEAEDAPPIDAEFLAMMECPVARVPLVQVGDWLYACDRVGRRKYPIRDGIPVMLVEEAQVADLEDFDRAMRTVEASHAPGEP